MRSYIRKQSGLEEEKLHINVGLNKIAETLAQVEELQKSLTVKSDEWLSWQTKPLPSNDLGTENAIMLKRALGHRPEDV